jgi:PAS domain S-box-containing protein
MLIEDRDATILIVDDKVANIKLLETILNRYTKYHIFKAESGAEALKVAEQQQPSLILLDIMMPDMDGYETCTQLKNNPETKDIAIIFISARQMLEDKVKALSMGAVDYISKPFYHTEVVARVNLHISLQTTRKSLRDSEKKYIKMLENIQDGIFLWNEQDGIHYFNKAFSKILGLQNNQTPSLEELIYEEDWMLVNDILKNAVSSGHKATEHDEYQVRMKRLDNGKILQTCWLPNADTYSGTINAFITVRDMTESIELEKQLIHKQKLEAIGSLTSGIAHDFNNILALINGYAELAMLELNEDSVLKENVQVILDAGKSAISLTKGLLAFSRKQSIGLQRLDLSLEIVRIKELIQRSLPAKIVLHTEVPDHSIWISGDAGMLQQVILNLCLNARDVMLPQGGNIHISMENLTIDSPPNSESTIIMPGDYVLVSIKDTGKGIPLEIQHKIFDPFFTTKKDGEGSGLGLAMVERIVKLHKGWIEVDSEPDKGTLFKLYFPLAHE